MYFITHFDAKDSKSKLCISPYGNRTFKFTKKLCLSLEECAETLSNHWCLSNSLNIDDDLIAIRNKQDLSKLRDVTNRLMVLDLDEITSSDDYYKVIEFFKERDYTCILSQSRSFNGIDNFNIKGFLKINVDSTEDNIRRHNDFLKYHIGEYCKVDETVKNDVSYQAPTRNNEIIHVQEDGTNFISINDIPSRQEPRSKQTQVIVNSNVIQKCMDIYMSLGYVVASTNINQNGSINWSHHSEVRSKGGFFMYIDRPFVMYHNNESRNLSIWNQIKKTEEGREYLKLLFKKQQEDNILDTTSYDNLCVINDRFINVDACSDIIDNFLGTSNSLLKIKSAMGTGKSLVIDRIIERSDERILIISNRISVALDYGKKYGIKTYLDSGTSMWKSGENLIVQYDSLHKYKLKDFDIIILDEFVSLLFQSRSELSKDNKNFNLSKFQSIMRGTRKVVIADAFLNGYENILFDKKFIFYIRNDYRDEISHFNYKHREMFFSSVVNVLNNREPGESVTMSVMSNNALNAMERKLTELGFNVATLTAATPELRKKKIYDIFDNRDGFGWDILLYSPTLTVGVSNMNNVKHHFHFDTGNAADVISSLQMVKRSRRATVLHTFLKETQKYNPTNSDDLDIMSNNDIVAYFNGKQSTLLIETDEDGDFRLSALGKFSNKIETLFNIFENNHSNAFKILLSEQFKFNTHEVETNDPSFSFYTMIKEHKESVKEATITMIERHKNCDYSDEHINELRSKTIDLAEDERTALILDKVKSRLKKGISRENLILLTELDIKNNGKFIKELELLSDAMSTHEEIEKKLSSIVAFSVNSTQNKEIIAFYTYLNSLKLERLEKWYSDKQINEIDEKLNYKKFKSFLRSIGYKSRNGRMELSIEHIKFVRYFL